MNRPALAATLAVATVGLAAAASPWILIGFLFGGVAAWLSFGATLIGVAGVAGVVTACHRSGLSDRPEAVLSIMAAASTAVLATTLGAAEAPPVMIWRSVALFAVAALLLIAMGIGVWAAARLWRMHP